MLRITGERNIAHRFGRETVFIRFGEAEKVTGQQEFRDLPPAVGHVLAQPHATADYAVSIFNRIAFIEDCFATFEAKL
jgi:hypothetical protein